MTISVRRLFLFATAVPLLLGSSAQLIERTLSAPIGPEYQVIEWLPSAPTVPKIHTALGPSDTNPT